MKKRSKSCYQTNSKVGKITPYFNDAKTFMFDLSSDVNSTPKPNDQSEEEMMRN